MTFLSLFLEFVSSMLHLPYLTETKETSFMLLIPFFLTFFWGCVK